MKATKEIRGITLIALVITIIVLLILAGVALATLTGNSSIIDNANYAVEEYNKSANADQNVIEGVENLFAKYMGGSSSAGDDDDDDDNTIGDLAATVHIGDYIIYNPTLGVTNASLLSYTSPVGTLKIKKTQNESEYVVEETGTDTHEYDGAHNLININGEFEIPANSSYYVESDVSGNGYGEQSFTATASNNLWRVLDVNTTTGVVKIIPETPIKTTINEEFGFSGLRGYKNQQRELNNISDIFGYGKKANGAQSITIEEVNSLTGYTYTQPNSPVTLGGISSWYITSYGYSEDDYGGVNERVASMIYKHDYGYWLASTCVSDQEISSNAIIFMHRIVTDIYNPWESDAGGVFVNGGWWTRIDTAEDIFGERYDGVKEGVMPVVTLKASANCLGGTGEQATPWLFQTAE